jgi:hypothetical protein
LLPLFCSASQQNNKLEAIPAEINTIARPEVYAIFMESGSNTLDIGKVALTDTGNRYRYLGRGLSVEAIEPFCVAATAVRCYIFTNFD